jgi:dTDP-4-dehydrorhamnose reductase
MKKIWVTGEKGQLGHELKLMSQESEMEFVFTSSAQVDITRPDEVEQFWQENRFQACVNTAAFTAVDKAETEEQAARLVNAQAVGFLAKTAAQHQALLIQISTDYVFDGRSCQPKKPQDPTDPLNIYGQTKLEGEQMALSLNPNTLIIRTSWLYGLKGKNFVKTMLKLAQTQPDLKVVYDQVGSPTSALDLAKAILHILSQAQPRAGVYHFSNLGLTSWFDFAMSIFEFSGLKPKVKPVESTEFVTAARRPSYSVMDCQKIQTEFGVEIPYWRDSLKIYLNRLEELKSELG